MRSHNDWQVYKGQILTPLVSGAVLGYSHWSAAESLAQWTPTLTPAISFLD